MTFLWKSHLTYNISIIINNQINQLLDHILLYSLSYVSLSPVSNCGFSLIVVSFKTLKMSLNTFLPHFANKSPLSSIISKYKIFSCWFSLLSLTDHFLCFRLFPASLLTSWQLQANTVAHVLCWRDSSTVRARHLRGDLCVHTLPTIPPTNLHKSCQHIWLWGLSLKNTRASSVMWVTPAISPGPGRDVALYTHYKQPLIDVAEIRKSNWFWLSPFVGELGHLVGDALFRFN